MDILTQSEDQKIDSPAVNCLGEQSDSSWWGGCLFFHALAVIIVFRRLGKQVTYVSLVLEGAALVLRL